MEIYLVLDTVGGFDGAFVPHKRTHVGGISGELKINKNFDDSSICRIANMCHRRIENNGISVTGFVLS